MTDGRTTGNPGAGWPGPEPTGSTGGPAGRWGPGPAVPPGPGAPGQFGPAGPGPAAAGPPGYHPAAGGGYGPTSPGGHAGGGTPDPSRYGSPGGGTPGRGVPPGPASAWWSAGGGSDPWRDPAAPAVLVQRPSGAAGPELDPLPPEPAPAGARGSRRPVGIVLTIVIALLAGLLGGALGYLGADRTTGGLLGPSTSNKPKAVDRAPDSVAGVVKRVLPSVVTVLIRTDTVRGNGSGFVISSSGYILTNNHVAAAGKGGELRVRFSDGSTVKASVKGTDPESDLAVLRVHKSGLTPVKFGDSERIAVGDPVIAIGAPLGLSNTVTSGIVSDLDRPVLTGREEGTESYMAAVQTDAAINPGNSGGPLLDGAGRVIGVNSAILTVGSSSGGQDKGGNIGLGFAIPIDQAKRVASDIIATGKARRTVIGATLDTSYHSPDGGVRLAKVTPDGPADRAGLRGGDVIVRYDHHRLKEPTDLIAFIRKDAPNTVSPVVYTRDGEKHSVDVTLAGTTAN